jgi:hypothetical protein
MKFNSQICTNKKQSIRLLKLGLKPETADCCLDDVIEGIYSPMALKKVFESQIPAWSLHRLIELCLEYINIDGHADTTYWFKMYKLDNKIIYENDYDRWIYLGDGDNLFDTLIDCIDWAINNKYFNMNYLN